MIGEKAAEWLVRLREGNLDIAERREYVRWLKQSPAHVAEMLRLAKVDGLVRETVLDGLFAESRRSRASTEYEGAASVIDFPLDQVGPNTSLEIDPPAKRARPWKLLAIVIAAVALLAVLGAVAKLI